MSYISTSKIEELTRELSLYLQQKVEYQAEGLQGVADKIEIQLSKAIDEVKNAPNDPKLAALEPNDLQSIKSLRSKGPRHLGKMVSEEYLSRLRGALIGRMAGCTLGAPVEFWSIERMASLARQNRTAFPPTDYWESVDFPDGIRYLVGKRETYTRPLMNGVPVDDDIEYILAGLRIAEDSGVDFTTHDVGKFWVENLPIAYSAERNAIANLKEGVDAMKAGETNNPYCEWIGAFIRCDPWAYMTPAKPEKAAELAYRDAYLSHRRQGIYGEMFFSAAISAAFALDDPMEALQIGLTEIPQECALHKAVTWALETARSIKNYQDARVAVEQKFSQMNPVHTINNACLTIFGIAIGQRDFTRVISETVAMGMDNDCTAATAGSLVGAIVGIDNIPEHWYAPFNDTIHSYSNICEKYSIEDVVCRFKELAIKNQCLKVA